MLRRLQFLALAAAATLAAQPALAQGLSPAQVGAGFREGAGYCLEAGLRGHSVADLPPAERAGLAPSSDGAREMVDDFQGELWDVLTAKGIVVLWEPTPNTCKVMAYGAPVDRTFKAILKDARKRAPDLDPVEVKPGYEPIVYRLQQATAAARLSLDLKGNEPGAPGHLFRFSKLHATVTREAANP